MRYEDYVAIPETKVPEGKEKQYICKYSGCFQPCKEAPSIICDGTCRYCNKECNALKAPGTHFFKKLTGSEKIYREVP